jgi:Protein of unknown function (DUF3187)
LAVLTTTKTSSQHPDALRALAVLGLIGLSCGSASAAEPAGPPAPLLARDLNPFIQVHGLPPLEAAEVTPAGHSQLQFTLDLANNAKLAEEGSESITLDGETYRLALWFRHGLSDRFEIGAEVPVVFHVSGVFDPFIEEWHALLGLPKGDRAEMQDNVLDFSYRDEGQEQVAIRSGRQGLGDVRLFAATTLYRAGDGARELGLRASLELPTGDSARLLGSGSTDLALSVNATERGWGSQRLTWFGRLGLLASTDSEVLAARQRHAVIFGGLALNWRAWSRVDLKAQLDVHGPFYRSELPQLDSTSVQVTFGGTIHLGPATALDLALGENLFIDTIPDVLLNVTLSHRM